MGLDISAYSKLKEVDLREDVDDHYDNDEVIIFSEFTYQLGTLKRGSAYKTKYISSFCAGSYSGYSCWRRDLLALVSEEVVDDYWDKYNIFSNYEYTEYQTYIRENKLKRILKSGDEIDLINLQNKPFIELICFSDCEGYVGPEVCKKLHLDFIKYNDVAKEKMSDWYYDLYKEFMDATSVDGCVLHYH